MNRVAIRFKKVLDRLDKLFVEAANTSDADKKEIILSYIVVKIHDQWNYRSRQIVLQSYQSHGHSAASMVKYLRDNWATNKTMNNNWEPDWHVPQNTIRAARLLNIPDYTQVKDALGAVIYIDDIRWTRNAIVHNIQASFLKYRKMALDKYYLSNIPPFVLPLERNPRTGNSIYEDWCNDLKNAICCAL